MNHISMELCLFQFSLQSAGFQILRLATVLFIGYSFQPLYFLSDQGNGRQFLPRRKSDFLIDFKLWYQGYLDICWVGTFCLIILYPQSHRRNQTK